MKGIDHILVSFRHIRDLNAVIGKVPQVNIRLRMNQWIFSPNKTIDDLPHGVNGFSYTDDLDFHIMEHFFGYGIIGRM